MISWVVAMCTHWDLHTCICEIIIINAQKGATFAQGYSATHGIILLLDGYRAIHGIILLFDGYRSIHSIILLLDVLSVSSLTAL